MGKILSSSVDERIKVKVLGYMKTLRRLETERERFELYSNNKFRDEFKPESVGKSVRRVSSVVVKRQLVASYPACLCLHVQRASLMASGQTFKNSRGVVFGKRLDIGPWVSRKGGGSPECPTVDADNVYALRAVVLHFGDDSSGHFVTYRCLSSCPLAITPGAVPELGSPRSHMRFNTMKLQEPEGQAPAKILGGSSGKCTASPAARGGGREPGMETMPWYRVSDERVSFVGDDWLYELRKYSSNVYILFYEKMVADDQW